MLNREFTWNLRGLMADHQIYKTTALIEPLKERGVTLSREQVFRLVTKAPQRLNTEVLVALCDIFDCEIGELVVITRTARAQARVNAREEQSIAPIGDLRPVAAKIARPRIPEN